ncbi:MAG: phosphatase PAP2 family protein [Bacteroidota bacterium]
MNETTRRIKQPYFFFTGYLFFFILGLLLLAAKGKVGSFIALNSFHKSWLDNFFIIYTYVGDGLFVVALSLLLFFVFSKRKLGLTLFIAYASTGILAQVIKPIVESPRPQTYFAPQWLPFFIRDVIHIGTSSFPSGHTVSAFAAATVVALFIQNKWLQVVLLLLAILVGFSRVYLSQHFLIDVLAGSFIGVGGGMLCVHWCRNMSEEKLGFKKR